MRVACPPSAEAFHVVDPSVWQPTVRQAASAPGGNVDAVEELDEDEDEDDETDVKSSVTVKS